MKLGMTIESFEGISAGKLVSLARIIMLDHIEINVRIIPDVEEVINNLGKMTTTFHLPIFGVEGYDPGAKGKKNEERMKEVITFINNYKNDLNLIFTLSHPPETADSTFELLIDRLQQIETPIVLENIPGQSDEDFVDFYFKAKDILGKQLAGHAIDAPHRFVTDWKNWLNIPKELLKEIVYVHITDCSKEEDSHLPLGLGEMPFNDFFELLKKNGYQGVINQEIKPKGLDQIEEILNSCLYCLKPFSKIRYIRTKTKYALLKPIIRRRIRKASKQQSK